MSIAVLFPAPLVGDVSGERSGDGEYAPLVFLAVQLSFLGVETVELSFEGVITLVGEVGAGRFGAASVLLRRGDGEAGDSGRRKGDVRGELKERVDGL